MNSASTRRFALFLVVLGFLMGCRGAKDLPAETVGPDTEVLSPKDILRALEDRAFPDYYQGRVSGVINDGSGTTHFSAKVLGRRDSIAIITVSVALGIEVGQVKLTPDSVVFINRFEKSYLADSYDALSEEVDIPIDLRLFEALFTGEPLFELRRKSNFSEGVEPQTYAYFDELKGGAAYAAVVRATDGLIATQTLQRSPEERAELSTSAFYPFDGYMWVRTGEMRYSNTAKEASTSLKYRTSGISTEKITTFPFEVPQSYVRKK